MFERFTDRARRIVVLAQEHARMLRHHSVGTEHLLLALISEEEGVAARTLRSMDVSLGDAEREVIKICGEGQQASNGHIPFTPQTKEVMDLALREALQLGHNYIGTEHLLLGLIREGGGVGVQALAALDVDLNALRRRVIEMQRGDYRVAKANRPFTLPAPDSAVSAAVTQIIVLVSDLDATRKFYEAVGLTFMERGDQQDGFITAKLGPGLYLMLAPCVENGSPVTGLSIQVLVADRNAVTDALEKLGHSPWVDATGFAQEAYVRDPDGNLVQLVPRLGLAA